MQWNDGCNWKYTLKRGTSSKNWFSLEIDDIHISLYANMAVNRSFGVCFVANTKQRLLMIGIILGKGYSFISTDHRPILSSMKGDYW